MNPIKQKVESLLNKLLEAAPDNVLSNDLVYNGVDSMKFVHLLISIENEFDIEIPDDFLTLDKLSTIDEIVALIERSQVN
ncbi:acyl carrier protein [Paenibacillus sp. FJAT-26967]|uniref:acyl carrier protein n=1 Tax=Paenibacillus sp. FJAT-26967 TaxID=1729690 RepID=UPI0008386479|nr:phosphopantetheine-binding protein [Paenibacillus sp. FJAT-26967]